MKAKKGGDLPGEWELFEEEKTPQQHNGCDCGVFSCMNAEALSLGLKLDFNQKHVTENARRRIALSVLTGEC